MEGAGLRQVPLVCSGHTRPVVHLSFSKCTPCGYFLVSASKDGKPMLRLGSTGDWIGTFQGHKGAVNGVAISDDACKAATASSDFTCKVWDAVSGEELASFTHGHIVRCVAFNNDCKKLLTAGNEKIVRLFDMDDRDADPIMFMGHEGAIKLISFLPDERRFLTLSDMDKTIRMWDTGRPLLPVYTFESKRSLSSFELSTEGNLLLVCEGEDVRLMEVGADGFTQIKTFSFPSLIHSASIDPTCKFIACGGADYIIRRVSIETGEEVESFKGHFGPVHCVKFSPDGELYASGSEDGTLRLWQTNVGTNYGLWKVVKPEEVTNENVATPETSTES